jgi:hypothetical protein
VALRTLAFALLACLLAGGAHAQRIANEFESTVMRHIDAVARFTPPEYAIGPVRESPLAFYGAAMNEFNRVSCERSASLGIVAKANMAGAIVVGICEREAKRVRALAASAQPALAGTIAMLRGSGATIDAAMLQKPEWKYAKTTGADGAEEHYFPVIAVGHGIAILQTLVRVPAGARRAIVVQADTIRLCENYGLKGRTPLCDDTPQALAAIARRLDAGVR